MNWDYTGQRNYVEVLSPTSPFLHPNTTNERSLHWPVHQAEVRLNPGSLRQPCISEQLEANIQQYGTAAVHSTPQAHPGSVLPNHRPALLRTTSLPPVDPSKQLASTPKMHQGTQSPTSSQNTPAIPQTAFSPLASAPTQAQQAGFAQGNSNMPEQGNPPGHQRTLMGPPETPSRVMQASPSMFPSLAFSPDLFSTQSMGPATAPVYPQQRLFWDQPMPQTGNVPVEQFHNPYQDSFDASFHSSSTVVPHYSPVVSQDAGFELSQHTSPTVPFINSSTFPMPFHTSPRPPAPAVENPTQFLSSPARRFGGSDIPITSSFQRPVREMPAYHHQIEESRREKELERRRYKTAAKRADADLIMSSVRRALSPTKSGRPVMKRSQTHLGLVGLEQNRRRRSRGTTNDSASTSSIASADSTRRGRSSPRKLANRPSSTMHKSQSMKIRTAISLAIDENGVAKTVLQELSESDDAMDVDENSQSVISSDDDDDFAISRSQNASFMIDGDHHETLNSQRSGIIGRATQSKRATALTSNGRSFSTNMLSANGKGDAQKALRAIIEDRSRSVSSAQGGYSSSRQSDSSVQFHSSPPVHQNQFGDFNGSPTTITDPDLATPSTDQESYGSLGSMRCICKSSLPDGSAMVQCDACSKLLHAKCVGVDKNRVSDTYICVYCEHTPVRPSTKRSSVRPSMRGSGHSASPLAHKSVKPNRAR